MFLTEDEFIILKGLLLNKSNKEISFDLNNRLLSCDPISFATETWCKVVLIKGIELIQE